MDEKELRSIWNGVVGRYYADHRIQVAVGAKVEGAIIAFGREIERLNNHIKMHAGDTLSLDNEVRTMRDHWMSEAPLLTSLRGDVSTLRTALVHAREALEFSLNKRHEKFEPEKFPIFAEIEAAMELTKEEGA